MMAEKGFLQCLQCLRLGQRITGESEHRNYFEFLFSFSLKMIHTKQIINKYELAQSFNEPIKAGSNTGCCD
jgi:hypothetical protein